MRIIITLSTQAQHSMHDPAAMHQLVEDSPTSSSIVSEPELLQNLVRHVLVLPCAASHALEL